jgi:hypothetical protein
MQVVAPELLMQAGVIKIQLLQSTQIVFCSLPRAVRVTHCRRIAQWRILLFAIATLKQSVKKKSRKVCAILFTLKGMLLFSAVLVAYLK